jgi:hypothetical protein
VAASVKLREGVNAIVLSASESDGSSVRSLRTVIYERPKVGAAAPGPRHPLGGSVGRW